MTDPQVPYILDIKVEDALHFSNLDLKDDILDHGLCSPVSANNPGKDEDWIGTGHIGPGALKHYKYLISKYCQNCPVRGQCYLYAVKSKCYDGVFAVHPKHRKKRVVKAQYKRTLKEMFGKLDRALNNLEQLDE